MPQSIYALAPLRHEMYYRIWLSSFFALIGYWALSVGASWLMLSINQSSETVALVQTALSLPVFIFALVGGVLSDLSSRRGVLIVAQLWMVIIAGLMTVCTVFGLINWWNLLLFTFLFGCGNAIRTPAWKASVNELVPSEDVPAAVALNSAAYNAARCVGPAAGGLILALGGAAAVFAFTVICSFYFAVILYNWKPSTFAFTDKREALGKATGAGFVSAWRTLAVRRALARLAAVSVPTAALAALLPLYITRYADVGSFAFGLLIGALGVGAALGAGIAASLRLSLSSERLLAWGTTMNGLSLVGLAAAANLTNVLWLMLIAALLVMANGASLLVAMTVLNTTVQLASPSWVRGRILSVLVMVISGGVAVGSAAWGYLAAWTSVATALAFAGLAMLATVMLGRWYTVPDVDPAIPTQADQSRPMGT